MEKIILVVDDDEAVRSFLSFSLRGDGYEVLSARYAEEAMAHLKGATPDLILLDIMLPTIDGFKLCAKIREERRFIRTPILFITAYAEANSVARSKEVGAQGLIEKPIMFDELSLQIMDALSGQFTVPTRLKFAA